jgi:hypothetical protein
VEPPGVARSCSAARSLGDRLTTAARNASARIYQSSDAAYDRRPQRSTPSLSPSPPASAGSQMTGRPRSQNADIVRARLRRHSITGDRLLRVRFRRPVSESGSPLRAAVAAWQRAARWPGPSSLRGRGRPVRRCLRFWGQRAGSRACARLRWVAEGGMSSARVLRRRPPGSSPRLVVARPKAAVATAERGELRSTSRATRADDIPPSAAQRSALEPYSMTSIPPM